MLLGVLPLWPISKMPRVAELAARLIDRIHRLESHEQFLW